MAKDPESVYNFALGLGPPGRLSGLTYVAFTTVYRVSMALLYGRTGLGRLATLKWWFWTGYQYSHKPSFWGAPGRRCVLVDT